MVKKNNKTNSDKKGKKMSAKKTLLTLIPSTPSAFTCAICPWPHLQRVHEKLALEALGMLDAEYAIGPYFDAWVLEGNKEKGFTGVGVTVEEARKFYKREAEKGKVPTLVESLAWIRTQIDNHLDDEGAIADWVAFATTFEFEESYLNELSAKTGVSREDVISKLAAVWNPIEDSHEFSKRLEALLEVPTKTGEPD